MKAPIERVLPMQVICQAHDIQVAGEELELLPQPEPEMTICL